MFTEERLRIWREVRRQRVCDPARRPGVLEGPGYLYRPEELLVAAEDLPLVREQLARAEATPDRERQELLKRAGLDLLAFRISTVPIPELVAQLRQVRTEDGRPVRVAPNHVFTGEPFYHGGPGGEPRPATGRELARAEGKPEVRVAALDTGVPKDLAVVHPGLATRLATETDDVDTLYDAGGLLDHEAGHGTFVSGIVAQLLGDATVDPERVLDSAGVGDDVTVSLGLVASRSPVTNASLGGYTHDDMPPLALASALARLGEDAVVVAAAGNNASNRPFWPAAFKQVVAVGAVDTREGQPVRAKFSNYGPWVDCCASGVDILSTYVRGDWRLHDSGQIEQFDGWACWSGTSFAAPQVAATIARYVAERGLTPRRAAHAVLADATVTVSDLGVLVDAGVDLVCRD